jgi:hypothetical protein
MTERTYRYSVSDETAETAFSFLREIAGPKGFHPGTSPAKTLKENDISSISGGHNITARLSDEGKIAPYPPGAKSFRAGYLICGAVIQEKTPGDEKFAKLEVVAANLAFTVGRALETLDETRKELEATLSDIEFLRRQASLPIE